jgi:hypothetical protein
MTISTSADATFNDIATQRVDAAIDAALTAIEDDTLDLYPPSADDLSLYGEYYIVVSEGLNNLNDLQAWNRPIYILFTLTENLPTESSQKALLVTVPMQAGSVEPDTSWPLSGQIDLYRIYDGFPPTEYDGEALYIISDPIPPLVPMAPLPGIHVGYIFSNRSTADLTPVQNMWDDNDGWVFGNVNDPIVFSGSFSGSTNILTVTR